MLHVSCSNFSQLSNSEKIENFSTILTNCLQCNVFIFGPPCILGCLLSAIHAAVRRFCVDISISSRRAIVLHGDNELSFSQARSTCIIEGGDLAATDSIGIINYIIRLVSEADNSAAYVYTVQLIAVCSQSLNHHRRHITQHWHL